MQVSLIELNTKLLTVTANAKKVKDVRSNIVNEIIDLVINEAKTMHVSFTNKRLAQKWIIMTLLEDKKIDQDIFTKRALVLSKKLLVDGYIIKKEFLALSMAEKLCLSDKKDVNLLMKIDTNEDGEEYIEAVKNLIDKDTKKRALKRIKEKGLSDKFEAFKALGLSSSEIALFNRTL